MRLFPSVVVMLVAAMFLAACQSSSVIPARKTVRNGLAGADLAPSVGFLDRSKALRAEYRALEYGATGAPIAWRGWQGRRGSVIPGPKYRVNTFDCRDYSHTVTAGGETVVARATACRRADGSWSVTI